MLIVFDITLNFLEKNMYANLLTRCDDACVITPYLSIYLLLRMQSFSHHGATCVEFPHFANLGIDGIILCSSPVSGNSVCVLI